MNATDIIAAHRHSPAATFYCGTTNAGVLYSKCGCGVRMSPHEHDQHLAEKLAEAGYGEGK